jgi:hypothetical protein
MSGDEVKARAKQMELRAGGVHDSIRALIVNGSMDRPISSKEMVRRISEISGKKTKTNYVHTYVRKFMEEGLIRAVRSNGARTNYYVLTSYTREEALRLVGKDRGILEIEDQLFSDSLTLKLKPKFATELKELQVNFGRCGNATAFLLRKILEKLIVIVFRKVSKMAAIDDARRPGAWKGLEELIDIAAREKVDGVALLLPRTAQELRGLKFLGDAAAHNPFIDVDMTTILPQMPYLITALGELSTHL